MSIVRGKEFGVRILNALGIDPDRVRGFSFSVTPKEGTVVIVERYMTKEGADAMIEVLENCDTEQFFVNRDKTDGV